MFNPTQPNPTQPNPQPWSMSFGTAALKAKFYWRWPAPKALIKPPASNETSGPNGLKGKFQSQSSSGSSHRGCQAPKEAPSLPAGLMGARKAFNGLHSGSVLPTDQDRQIVSLLRRDLLMEFVRCFLFFDQMKGKIAAQYQQVFGAKPMLIRVSQRSVDGASESGVTCAPSKT